MTALCRGLPIRSDGIGRFGDWAAFAPLLSPGPVRDTFSLLNADGLNDRMNDIRRSIEAVRRDWGAQYARRFDEVRAVLETEGAAIGDGSELGRQIADLLREPRDFTDRATPEAPRNYDVVRLYTSEVGYNAIFSVINRVFRSKGDARFMTAANASAFLVELLNIDLYNYWSYSLGRKAFSDVVYRGMCVSKPDLASVYAGLMRGSVKARSIGVPLGMVSTSINPEVPLLFIRRELEKRPELVPLLWKIHTVDLGEELIRRYQARFDSVVSSICAVPICRISEFPGEEEVLLRGPFFQVLSFDERTEEFSPIGSQPVSMIEAAMLTANRDHPSTLALGERDPAARGLFAALIALRKHQFCEGFHAARGEQDQAVLYRAEYEAARKRVTDFEQSQPS